MRINGVQIGAGSLGIGFYEWELLMLFLKVRNI